MIEIEEREMIEVEMIEVEIVTEIDRDGER